MIICYFYVYRVAVFPNKTNAPLVIYSNTVLPRPVAGQFFQHVRGGNAKVIDALRIVYHAQLS